MYIRYTDTVELKAQGIGNILSSLIGGLPMTSVVVRSSANNSAGAKSKMSAIIHGVLLLISVLAVPVILNKIPLAIATILILVGYKL
jgi:MFS superfamily sulfate permease-like transporter